MYRHMAIEMAISMANGYLHGCVQLCLPAMEEARSSYAGSGGAANSQEVGPNRANQTNQQTIDLTPFVFHFRFHAGVASHMMLQTCASRALPE